MISNGVDASDFKRITSRIGGWSEWCSSWSEGARVHLELGQASQDAGHGLSAGAHFARASVYFHFGKFLFVDYPDEMRQAHDRSLAAHRLALGLLDPPGQRVTFEYRDTTLPGILRLPRQSLTPVPVVTLVPGLDSTKEEFGATETFFLDRGMATLSIDGPGQGESEYELAAVADWGEVGQAVLAFISSRQELDSERVGVWGISLGGYYAPRIAATNPGFKACVALSGPFDLASSYEKLPSLTKRAFQARTKARDEWEAKALAHEFTLEGIAGNIKCPILVIAGEKDALFSPTEAERLHGAARENSRLAILPGGNHGCSNMPYRHRYLSADWMAERLLAYRS